MGIWTKATFEGESIEGYYNHERRDYNRDVFVCPDNEYAIYLWKSDD